MKFGVVSYENKYMRLDGKDKQNIGDWIQTIAMENLYKEWGIRDYIFVSRNTARDYQGEYVILPFNGVMGASDCKGQSVHPFPLSEKIVPVFFSMHYRGKVISEKTRRQFQAFAPVGCRDEGTMKLLRSYGIAAYVTGCVTATLPRRQSVPEKQDETVFIDVPKEAEAYIPENLRKKAVYRSNLYCLDRTSGGHYMTEEEADRAYESAKEQLAYLKDHAGLVVTSRLHAAMPCIAMGIPVILLKMDFDTRFSFVEKYIHPYRRDEWADINWNPAAVDYESEKEMIKDTMKKLFFAACDKYQGLLSVSEFYENRDRIQYNYLMHSGVGKIREKIKNSGITGYALWGVKEEAVCLTDTLAEMLPDLELKRVYDRQVTGIYEGITVNKPEKLDLKENLIYLVIFKSGRDDVRAMFEKNNRKYVFVDLNGEDWENNL